MEWKSWGAHLNGSSCKTYINKYLWAVSFFWWKPNTMGLNALREHVPQTFYCPNTKKIIPKLAMYTMIWIRKTKISKSVKFMNSRITYPASDSASISTTHATSMTTCDIYIIDNTWCIRRQDMNIDQPCNTNPFLQVKNLMDQSNPDGTPGATRD